MYLRQSAFKTNPEERILNMAVLWKCEVTPCLTFLKPQPQPFYLILKLPPT